MMMKKTILRRLLKSLSQNMTEGFCFEHNGASYQINTKKVLMIDEEIIHALLNKDAISMEDNRIRLTRIGLDLMTEEIGLEVSPESVSTANARQEATVKISPPMSESPLARLFARKTKDGASYISENEFNAGERLRADFERGNLQPRISANLSMTAGLSGKGGFHQAHEISDFAIDARGRVNKAIGELGPELSGVALDVCCFLKGLETVERERQWPPRSAKLMLKTALSALVRHYGLASRGDVSDPVIRAWGMEDYRPHL